MKTLFASLLLIAFSCSNGFAQIPNPGFESWSNNTFPAYDNPVNWGTVNDQTAIIGINTVQKESDTSNVHSGTYSCKLETFYIAFATETAPGITGTGTFNATTRAVEGGFADTSRPEQLTGWYKYTPATADNCDVNVELWRWNGNTREVIADGTFTNSDTVATFEQFMVQLNYYSNANPDSGRIIISSSNTSSPVEGSVMYVDDLEFTGFVNGIKSVENIVDVQLFPNPTNAFINIQTTSQFYGLIRLVSVTGQLVLEQDFMQNNTTLDCTNLAEGIYFYQMIDNNGQHVASGKININ